MNISDLKQNFLKYCHNLEFPFPMSIYKRIISISSCIIATYLKFIKKLQSAGNKKAYRKKPVCLKYY